MNDFYSNIETKQCVAIWRMTLNLALTDALNGNRIEKRSAIRWFFNDDKDFYFVCDCAQVSPHKIRSFLINEFAIRDPDIIKNTLYEEPRKGCYPKIILARKSLPSIETNSPISFIYKALEMRAYVADNRLWFNLSHLGQLWKFSDAQEIGLHDINTFIDPKHLRRKKDKKLTLFADSTGIEQLSDSFKSNKLSLFAKWIKKGTYKHNLLETQNTFKLTFQNQEIQACLFRNELFLHFKNVSAIFFLTTPSYKENVRQKSKYFYAYLCSKKRQLVVRTDLLLQLIEARQPGLKRYAEVKPKLIQWIKEQQQLFERETNDK